MMGPVILPDSGGVWNGRVVMVVGMRVVCREQTVLLEEFFSPGYEMKFWGKDRLELDRLSEHWTLPGSPFHMLRSTCIWLATCFLDRSTPAF